MKVSYLVVIESPEPNQPSSAEVEKGRQILMLTMAARVEAGHSVEVSAGPPREAFFHRPADDRALACN